MKTNLDFFSVAETFYSLKGEGLHTGKPMYFLRLAGCNKAKLDPNPVLLSRTGGSSRLCTNWDGRTFKCDTNFELFQQLTVPEVVNDMINKAGNDILWVVVTGGEPLMEHNIELLQELNEVLGHFDPPKRMHIETNGTCFIPTFAFKPYVACSPKDGYLWQTISKADELRLIIHEDTKDEFPSNFLLHPNVSLSPCNYASGGVNDASTKRCIELLRSHPNWRFNIQLHKILGIA